MKTAVIIARFQCPFLHDGYTDLINYARNNADDVMIILGEPPLKLTDKNPLPFKYRYAMIKAAYPHVNVIALEDKYSDHEWSKALDKILFQVKEPTLLGSRESFIGFYKGQYPTRMYQHTVEVSSSGIRANISKIENIGREMAIGMIYAIENKPSIVHSSVHIAIMNELSQVLLVTNNMSGLSFIGELTSPSDESLMFSAFRCLSETINDVDIMVPLKLVDSYKLDDWRYRGTKESVMTTLFTCIIRNKVISTPTDKPCSLGWYSVEHLGSALLRDSHKVLFNGLKKYLYE